MNTQSNSLKTIYICFPGGKHKALTMSFDDGRVEDRRLVEIFNKFGIKGTFNLNSGMSKDERRIPCSEYPSLYQGHEIACHTRTHPTVARCPLEQTAYQVLEDRRALENLTGYPVRGLAYPNGSYSNEIINLLAGLGIRYARTVRSTGEFSMPQSWLEWHPTCHFQNNLMSLGKTFRELYKTQYLYLMYVWGHSYELPDNNGWELMEEFCRFIGGHDDIWYATNIDIVDYMEQAKLLQFSAAGDMVYNPNFASMWISVDGEALEIPGGTTVRI